MRRLSVLFSAFVATASLASASTIYDADLTFLGDFDGMRQSTDPTVALVLSGSDSGSFTEQFSSFPGGNWSWTFTGEIGPGYFTWDYDANYTRLSNSNVGISAVNGAIESQQGLLNGDTLTFNGTGPIEVEFTLLTTYITADVLSSSDIDTSFSFRDSGGTPLGSLGYFNNPNASGSTSGGNATTTFTVNPGDTVELSYQFDWDVAVGLSSAGSVGGSVDTTIVAYITSISPGATVTSVSGRDYLSPVAAIPEPSTYAMIVAGLLGLAFVLRRRR